LSIAGRSARSIVDVRSGGGWTETKWSSGSPWKVSGILNSGAFGLVVAASGELSPSSVLGLLRIEASSVTNLGHEVVNGVDRVALLGAIPLFRLGASSTAELDEAERALGTTSLSVDYWIDSSKFLQQLRSTITIRRAPSSTATTAQGEVAVPLSYPVTIFLQPRTAHYGTRVRVVPPPSGDITSPRSPDRPPGILTDR
jgi:hypothetical protein